MNEKQSARAREMAHKMKFNGNGLIHSNPNYILENSFISGYKQGMKEAFEWIPVSERLPKENLRVLVKLKNGKTDVASLISFPDKYHENGKRMYWKISTSTMYWFYEVEYFRYINLEDIP